MPVVGFLNTRSADVSTQLVAAFRRGLAENSYVEGQTVRVEYRWANGQYDRLQALAAELVLHPPAVLVATGGEPAAMAAKAASSIIPIVFAIGGDPIKLGLVRSYNRPGGNATGMNILTNALAAKRLGLLYELVANARAVGFLINPTLTIAESPLSDTEEAARAMGVQLHILRASTDGEIDTAFQSLAQHGISALAVAADPFFNTRRDKLMALAARHAVPTLYQSREYPEAGGLMSYGIDLAEV
jgi:putative ABC transport system substrate-binding protein